MQTGRADPVPRKRGNRRLTEPLRSAAKCEVPRDSHEYCRVGGMMIDETARLSAQPTLRARGPAYSVMQECLRIQDLAVPRGATARLFGRSPLHPDARSWYQGALGEIEVARVLSKLGSEWTVLHAIPVGSGDSDIDHLVIGPAGIFTINTKHHAGKKIWVGGAALKIDNFKTDHIRNSLHEATRAGRLLSAAVGIQTEVTPFIVIVASDSITKGKTKPKVTVLPSSWLYRWLKRCPHIYSNTEVARFSMIAEKRSTWHTQAVALDDTMRYVQRFERLQHELADARSRAKAWVAVSVIAPIGIFLFLIIAVLPPAISSMFVR
jgi:hypothetical protein